MHFWYKSKNFACKSAQSWAFDLGPPTRRWDDSAQISFLIQRHDVLSIFHILCAYVKRLFLCVYVCVFCVRLLRVNRICLLHSIHQYFVLFSVDLNNLLSAFVWEFVLFVCRRHLHNTFFFLAYYLFVDELFVYFIYFQLSQLLLQSLKQFNLNLMQIYLTF